MFKKILLSLTLILTLILVFQTGSFLFASERPALKKYTPEEISAEVKELNSSILKKKAKLQELKAKQASYKQKIKAVQSKKASLENQLAILDNRVAEAQLNIDHVSLNIEQIDLEIKKTNLEIKAKEQKIETEKKQLAIALKLLYQQGNKNDVEIMLSYDTLSSYLDQVKYLKDLNSGITEGLDELKNNKIKLEQQKKQAEEKEQSLTKLKQELKQKQEILLADQNSKQIILSQTKSSEREYQRLLKLAKKEQENAASEIVNMEKKMREKLAKSGNNKLLADKNKETTLIWPVPSRTITTYFHDPDYPFRYLFEHPAIDIRASQGTQIKAAANGYVARTKFKGDSSYAYIMLVHSNGLATVYGHVSKIYVKEDDYVSQGQIIGLTGGTPGTPGAGQLTTGPHIHFEVRLNGIPVNPLDYLP